MLTLTSLEQELHKNRKRTRCLVIISTVIYALLFPVIGTLTFLCFGGFDCPSRIALIDWLTMFAIVCVPLSVPTSIYFMWSRYRRGQYKKASFFSTLPVAILTCMLFVGFLANWSKS